MKRTILLSALLSASLSLWAGQAYVSTLGPGGSVSQFSHAGALNKTYATPPGAIDFVLSPDGTKLYLGTTNTQQIDVGGGSPAVIATLDPSTGAVLHTYNLPASVVQMVLNPAGDHIFATGLQGSGDVAVVISLDLRTGAANAVPLPHASSFSLFAIAISPDGKALYVPVNSQIDTFDAATLTYTGAIALASNAIVAPPAITPDGSTLLAAGAAKVYVIDLKQRVLKTTIAIGEPAAAFGSLLSPDGNTFYVSAGTLTAVDVPGLTVKGTVSLNQSNPYRLALSADGSILYSTDLTYNTVTVVDTASLTAQGTFQALGSPYEIAVTASGRLLVLNGNSSPIVRVNTTSMTAGPGFLAGDTPLAPIFIANKLFVPESSNVAVEESVGTPVMAKPLADNFIIPDSATKLGGKVFVDSGGVVRVIDPVSESVIDTFLINTGGAVLQLTASGDRHSLLASYEVIGIGIVLTDCGIVKADTTTSTQQLLSSYPFVPGAVASSPTGDRTYGLGFNDANQVGVWDTQDNSFLNTTTLPGNPNYVALAVSSDGSTLYLVDQNGKVDFVGASDMQVKASVTLGSRPSAIAVNADGTEALISDGASSSVTVLDLVNRVVKGTIVVGRGSSGAVYLN